MRTATVGASAQASEAAVNMANVLAAHIKTGDSSYSPLPFKVNVFTGETGLLRHHDFTGTWIDTAGYTTNWAPTLNLFIDLIAFEKLLSKALSRLSIGI